MIKKKNSGRGVNIPPQKVFPPEAKPKPQGIKAPEPKKPQVKKIAPEVATAKILGEMRYNDGRLRGFGEGVRYIVTLAETILARHEKLENRNALRQNVSLLPAWWIATLVTALDYDPPYAPVTPKKGKQESEEPKLEESGDE